MALFERKNEKTVTSCCGSQIADEATICCGEKADGICCIKVLGSGCKACHQLYDNARKAAEGMGIEVEYITDLQTVMEYGVMSMPALVINDKVVSQGRTLGAAQITGIIQQQI
ncbi:MAG: thioredoxin family protein [Oscillospiraceae bacterium]|nr:thioredoxin family protein [Oscillospiraceae bacterium]